MKKIIFILVFINQTLYGQQEDSLKSNSDTTAQTEKLLINRQTMADTFNARSLLKLDKKPMLMRPTMPSLHMSEDQKKFYIQVDNNHLRNPAEKTNWDALNKPTTRTDYEITHEYLKPYIQTQPLFEPTKEVYQPLNWQDYLIPTRQELEILEVLWTKENVLGTTIYSCLDTTLNITMEDLNQLLGEMVKKDLVYRKIVSPRNEFNAFGNLIEMSSQNRRNRVYEYKSKVDRDIMRRFINANAYLFKNDSSIVNLKQLNAARNDKTLLNDLDFKIHTSEQ